MTKIARSSWIAVDEDREVALVGGGIAAAAGVVLLASLFVGWYRHGAWCFSSACGATVSGFSALGAQSAGLVCAAVAACLPLAAGCATSRLTRPLSAVAVAGGLGAGLLIVFRIVAVPASVSKPSDARLIGVFIALLGAGGVVGGSALAGIGRRLFEPVRQPWPWLTVIAGASVAMIASPFTPWVRTSAPLTGRTVTETAWQAGSTLGGLLVLGAIAILAAAGVVAAIRWRAAFFALAVGAWLAAAVAVTATVLAVRSSTPHGTQAAPRRTLAAPRGTLAARGATLVEPTGTAATRSGPVRAACQPGYYVFLAAATVIVFSGVRVAVAGTPRAAWG